MMHPRIAQSQVPLRTEQVDEVVVTTVESRTHGIAFRGTLTSNVLHFSHFSLHYHAQSFLFKPFWAAPHTHHYSKGEIFVKYNRIHFAIDSGEKLNELKEQYNKILG